MSSTSSQGIDRRGFLKGAGLGAFGLAATGMLAACSPSNATSDGEGGGTGTGSNAGSGSGSGSGAAWRTPPAEITSFVQELDFDAVCIGHGYAGLTSCRELAESGKKVALIERQAEESYMAMGNESCSLNSEVLRKKGIPDVDPVEYYQNWMAISGNYPHQELIMKFCQHMGEHADWYYSPLSEEDFATMTTTGWPGGEHRLSHIGPYKFWPGTASFYGECNQTKIQGYNREVAKEHGAEFFFEMDAQYVIMEGDAVAGIVATGPDGDYKFNCKAVVIATGGFSYNTEMIKDLMPDLANALVEGEEFNAPAEEGAFSLSNPNANGRGIQMAYWAGAHLETIPVPGMNAKHIQPPAGMTNLPQAVWINSAGKRFCNEYYPVVEQRGIPPVYSVREPISCVFDADFATYRQYYVPQHGAFDPTEQNIASLEEAMATAKAKFEGTYVEPEVAEEAGAMGPMSAIDYLCDNTLEGLAGQLGYTGEAVANFVASIERYNEYCEKGVDEEFGRYPEVLFPVKNAPFFAAAGNPGLGEMMCTMGGIITDGEQNALDKDFKPIPGLYVSGNDCGRRWGLEYFTPTPGVSLGIAITLGREAGRSVNAFFEG